MRNESPSLSSTSEFEINDKNNVGLVLEYFQNRNLSFGESSGTDSMNGVLTDSFHQTQNTWGLAGPWEPICSINTTIKKKAKS